MNRAEFMKLLSAHEKAFPQSKRGDSKPRGFAGAKLARAAEGHMLTRRGRRVGESPGKRMLSLKQVKPQVHDIHDRRAVHQRLAEWLSTMPGAFEKALKAANRRYERWSGFHGRYVAHQGQREKARRIRQGCNTGYQVATGATGRVNVI